jgi:hypothetical protein
MIPRPCIVRRLVVAPVVVAVVVLCVAGRASPAWAGPDDDPDTGEWTGGFRMEGDPKIETVFGDAEQFKRYIDRFFTVHAEMQKSLEDFSRNVQAVLGSLEAHKQAGGKGCPVDAVALAYARAFRLGQVYHRHGKELESNYISIRELDSLGETKGLTPDYRWKVSKALKAYPQVLKDFKEMRVAFQDQLASELKYKGCDAQVLITKGEEIEKTGAPPTAETARADAKPNPKDKKKKDQPVTPPVQASTATFFVDNSTCATTVRVFLDSAFLGEVGSQAKAAFRSLVGRHELCLIPSSSQQQCGDPGTLRRTYIHDGWSITLRCD